MLCSVLWVWQIDSVCQSLVITWIWYVLSDPLKRALATSSKKVFELQQKDAQKRIQIRKTLWGKRKVFPHDHSPCFNEFEATCSHKLNSTTADPHISSVFCFESVSISIFLKNVIWRH